MEEVIVEDELDNEIFICDKCGGKFNHADGTWLEIGENESNLFKQDGVCYMLDHRKPEPITSDKFTCYDCI